MIKKTFTDQLFSTVEIAFPPKRIISLVPSQTELLFFLQLDDVIAGITKFCIHPEKEIKNKPIVGGTKNFWFDAIDKIQPDLIIGNKEENYQEGIEQLALKYPVWMSDISSIENALQMIKSIGEITDTVSKAESLAKEIELSFAALMVKNPAKVVYLIWKSPWMAAGRNTFINSWLSRLGFLNVITESRYPVLSNEQLRQLNPELVLLSSEPFPFRGNHIQELQAILPKAKIMIVDGEMFSWYGNRMLNAGEYFNCLNFNR